MTAPAPAFVEVFGDDGELRPILIEDASDDALEDGLAILRQRKAAIERDIAGLDALLRQRRGEPVTVAPTSYADLAQALRRALFKPEGET